MRDDHRTHLVSTYTTVLQHLEEIRQAAIAGRSPAGGRLTPLPKPMQDRLAADLAKIAAGVEELVRAFVPDWQQTSKDVPALAATRMWISILLRTVQELVGDLLPSRMSRKYGALEPAEAERMQREVERVLAWVREALMVSEQAREPEDTP